MLAYRCTFVSGTYGILNVHFVFRYLTLNQKLKIVKYFMPFGLIISIIYVLFHMIIWGWIDYEFLYGSAEKRDYIRIPFKQMYNESVDDIDLVSGLFSETTPEISQRSWTGILTVSFSLSHSLTVIASYSIILYFVLGHKIVKSIDTSSITMSKQTTQMQKQLFRALFLQTIIPICVSFLPCSLSFYGAALRIDFMNWVYWGSSVAVSMFPFLDPMAIIFCLPALRRRIVNPCKSKNSVVPVTNHVSEASNVQ
uniref:Serpentine Receptor, class J n=1 Tax=Caenorhabditis tropicalis TaxID=1561998 RepID=A0A1I7TYK8_9PELO